MSAAIETTTQRRRGLTDAYRETLNRSAIDAAFLWLLRSIAVERPDYSIEDLAALEQRIDAQLDVLMTSTDAGWAACAEGLAIGEPGEIFTATVIAMRSHDVGKIQAAVQTGLANGPNAFKGLVSALGWLPVEIARPWIDRLLNGKDMNHKYLGLAACSVRRHDPGEMLTTILARPDCRQYEPVYARALRLVGELRRLDLMPALQTASEAAQIPIAFWANWSLILLGRHAQAKLLQPFVSKSGPFQARAIQLIFRALPIDPARELISTLSKDSAQMCTVVVATGVLGDPHAVNWLVNKMNDPKLARVAGEAFALITGIDLAKPGIDLRREGATPSDDAVDTAGDLDADEHLPWPDPDKIATLWRNHSSNFLVGRRYCLGKPVAPEWLKRVISAGTMRQRHAAALELALIDSDSRLANTRARCLAW